MADQTLKSMTQTRDISVGHFIVEFATPGIGHLMKNAGADYVLFDMEHSGFSIETVKRCVRYMEAANLPMITRVPSKSYDHIARVLDMGAEGVMVPMVNDADEARAVVDAVKYGPEGKRGVALGIAHDLQGSRLEGVWTRLAVASGGGDPVHEGQTAGGGDRLGGDPDLLDVRGHGHGGDEVEPGEGGGHGLVGVTGHGGVAWLGVSLER